MTRSPAGASASHTQPKRVVAYARTALNWQSALDTQLSIIDDWAATNGAVVVDTHIDRGPRLRKSIAAGLEAALLVVEEGRAEAIVIVDGSLIARDMDSLVAFLDRLYAARADLYLAIEGHVPVKVLHPLARMLANWTRDTL